ncbi:VTS1 [Sanghuangporus vaninii]
MSLRPPSTSPSPSPAPNGTSKTNARASMGPSSHRPAPINLNPPASPRPGTGRPTSELLGNSGMFQTPEAEAIDQWFENLQNYEATLEEMAAASLDVNFKEELSAIEQWFRVLSEAERTAALYSLLQHSTQVQIRFFITVLQQMARADPMTALLSPNAGGSMQSQMEAKLASMGLKSPGLKSNMPSSPSARNFSGNLSANRQSLAVEPSSSSFLSPDSAANSGNNDGAATLAQQRAKLKANAAHRISAPALAGAAGNNVWGGSGASSLGQVAERMTDSDGAQEITIPASTSTTINSARPKSTDFSGLLRSPRLNRETADGESLEAQLSPMVGGNWASMVNTPHDLMFNVEKQNNGGQNLDAAAAKLASWQVGNSGGRFSLDDAKKFRRPSKGTGNENGANAMQNGPSASNANNAIYGDDGNVINAGPHRNGRPQGWANNSSLRSPALSNVSSGRFGGSDDGGMTAMNMNNAFGLGIPSPGLSNMGGLGNMATMQQLMAAAQMGQLTPLQMQQLNMNMMGLNMGMPDVQMQALLQAQMAAGGFMQPGLGFGAQAALLNNMNGRNNTRGPSRMGGGSGGSGSRSNNGRDGKDKEDDVDPSLLNDVPAWLRSLRLHKYTPNFEGMTWREMVVMDEAALEAKGVAALGARRKMLKTFETVRHKMGIEMPNSSSSGGDTTAAKFDGADNGEGAPSSG